MQYFKLSKSFLAAARWIRKGKSTASAVDASAAVQVQGAAVSCASAAEASASADTGTSGAREGGPESRINWERTCCIVSRLLSRVAVEVDEDEATIGAVADGLVNSPRIGMPIKSRTCLSVNSGLERR